jgi:hypothetical protein
MHCFRSTDSNTYTISVNGTSTSSFAISTSDVSAAVTAINLISSTTGVTATATTDNKVLLADADGDDITIENADSDSGLKVFTVGLDQSTTAGSEVSLAAVNGNDSTRVVGTLRLTSDNDFSVTQSGTAIRDMSQRDQAPSTTLPGLVLQALQMHRTAWQFSMARLTRFRLLEVPSALSTIA